jgi:hypothetical protein
MESEKKCRRCQNSPPMHKSNSLFFIPAMGDAQQGTESTPMLQQAGVLVRAHECPVCRLVEFYREEHP